MRVLGDSGAREAAVLWRAKQLEYSFRLTAMGRYEDYRWVTSCALDFALASPGTRLPDGQAGRLVELYGHLQPFQDAVPAPEALAGLLGRDQGALGKVAVEPLMQPSADPGGALAPPGSRPAWRCRRRPAGRR